MRHFWEETLPGALELPFPGVKTPHRRNLRLLESHQQQDQGPFGDEPEEDEWITPGAAPAAAPEPGPPERETRREPEPEPAVRREQRGGWEQQSRREADDPWQSDPDDGVSRTGDGTFRTDQPEPRKDEPKSHKDDDR